MSVNSMRTSCLHASEQSIPTGTRDRAVRSDLPCRTQHELIICAEVVLTTKSMNAHRRGKVLLKASERPKSRPTLMWWATSYALRFTRPTPRMANSRSRPSTRDPNRIHSLRSANAR